MSDGLPASGTAAGEEIFERRRKTNNASLLNCTTASPLEWPFFVFSSPVRNTPGHGEAYHPFPRKKPFFILLCFYFFSAPLLEPRGSCTGFEVACTEISMTALVNGSEFLVKSTGLNRSFHLSSLSSSGSLQLEFSFEILFPPSHSNPFFLESG